MKDKQTDTFVKEDQLEQHNKKQKRMLKIINFNLVTMNEIHV